MTQPYDYAAQGPEGSQAPTSAPIPDLFAMPPDIFAAPTPDLHLYVITLFAVSNDSTHKADSVVQLQMAEDEQSLHQLLPTFNRKEHPEGQWEGHAEVAFPIPNNILLRAADMIRAASGEVPLPSRELPRTRTVETLQGTVVNDIVLEENPTVAVSEDHVLHIG